VCGDVCTEVIFTVSVHWHMALASLGWVASSHWVTSLFDLDFPWDFRWA